ncbi:hypothetical protein [Anabaena sp. PCC 7108]|uniref:hypothetical protein n=1 Tax=Anabaena sp. PCC 7108 TaxID=163908 RepID=UPI000349A8CD|nr:hypothetical protein [Anabaena sp. PCC 7108]
MDGVWDEIQYLSVKLKTLNQVGWGAIALDGFPGLWRMAFDVRKPNIYGLLLGCAVA